MLVRLVLPQFLLILQGRQRWKIRFFGPYGNMPRRTDLRAFVTRMSANYLSQFTSACGKRPSARCLGSAMVFLACLSAGMGELYAQRISIGAEAGVS